MSVCRDLGVWGGRGPSSGPSFWASLFERAAVSSQRELELEIQRELELEIETWARGRVYCRCIFE